MDFSGRISDAETGLSIAGFTTGIDNLWAPPSGWYLPDEALAAEAPFPPQYLASLYVLHHFFASLAKKAWVHLAASMQAGKTGVVTALIRLMFANRSIVNIHEYDVFVITGMNDNAWKQQTKARLPRVFRNNVHHSKGLSKVAKALKDKAEHNGGELKNVLIVQDESHIACGVKNEPSLIIYNTLCALCPVDKWAENNIRLLTISATDPSATIGVASRADTAIVKLMTSEGYQSPESLLASGRLHETFGLHDEASVLKMLAFVDTTFRGGALWHIVRPKSGKSTVVAEILTRLGRRVKKCDCENGKRAASGDDGSSVSMEDINDTLCTPPAAGETFVVLKNMFYAAKTLDDSHVGLMFDRLGHKDDTNLQSLIGRACGYGKSETTQIFGSITTVRNFVEVWSKVAPTETVFPDIDVSALKRKMNGVSVVSSGDGGSALKVASSRRLPTGRACGGAGRADEPAAAAADDEGAAARATLKEDDFDHEWSEWFPTEADVLRQWKAWGGRGAALKTNDDGFLVCSTTGAAKVVKKEEIDNFRGGKKTANMPAASKLKAGESNCRRYVAYRDVTDKSTAEFCVHMIKRKVPSA
jgi:hypothetical protein